MYFLLRVSCFLIFFDVFFFYMIPYLRKFVRVLRAVVRWVGIALFIGVVAVLSVRFGLPFLASIKPFSKLSLLETTKENTTVINNREEIIIREDDRLDRSVQNVENSLVHIMVSDETDTVSKDVISLTGVLLTTDGLLVTSVSEDFGSAKNRYQVMDFGGNRFEGEFFAYDSFSHLLYLRISGRSFTPIVFADSNDFSSGRKVIGLGETDIPNQNKLFPGSIDFYDSTFSLANQVLSSSEKREGAFEISFVQDRSIDSGTAVLSYTGELVGMYGLRTIGNQTYPYVIRGNDIKESMQKYVSNPNYQGAYLGVSYTSLTPFIAKKNNLSKESGAWLSFEKQANSSAPVVLLGSPAQKAGLRSGDIILSVNDRAVTYEKPLSSILSTFQGQDEITLTVFRQGGEQKIKVTLGTISKEEL